MGARLASCSREGGLSAARLRARLFWRFSGPLTVTSVYLSVCPVIFACVCCGCCVLFEFLLSAFRRGRGEHEALLWAFYFSCLLSSSFFPARCVCACEAARRYYTSRVFFHRGLSPRLQASIGLPRATPARWETTLGDVHHASRAKAFAQRSQFLRAACLRYGERGREESERKRRCRKVVRWWVAIGFLACLLAWARACVRVRG